MIITSSQNPVIKEVKSLKSRKDRDEKGLFFVEGVRIVEEAVKENANIKYTVMSENFTSGAFGSVLTENLERLGCMNYTVPDRLFTEIADTETPQGILAVIGSKWSELSDETVKEGLFTILESVKDPGNMGAIIRTADAAGFTGVIISSGCVDVYNPKVLRSTVGSIFHIPIYHYDDVLEAISLVKSKGLRVYASHLKGTCSIYKADMTAGTAIIIGSEAAGISPEAASQADLLVRIPMAGKAESLNASVAAGIMMYEAVRQRQHCR